MKKANIYRYYFKLRLMCIGINPSNLPCRQADLLMQIKKLANRSKMGIVLWLIILLGVMLRLWQLGSVPDGFYSDEALYGYEAYSLLKTGKDQFGNDWPLSIAGFGDFRPAGYIYATAPFVSLFGLNELATRLPSALFSVFLVVLTYYFVHQITSNTKIALFSTLILSLSPWSIFFGRIAHETNLQTFMILASIVLLVSKRKDMFILIMAVLLLAGSLYVYHSARVFVPLFLVLTFLVYRKNLMANKKIWYLGFLFFLLAILPLTSDFSGERLSRIQGVSIWTDPGIIAAINESRRVAQINGASAWQARLKYNKATFLPQVFLSNLGSHFTLDFLLFEGDPNGIYNTPNTGILLWIEPALILIGAFYLWKRRRRLFWWVIGVLFIGLIPDSLTRLSPSSARIHLLLPFSALLSGVGLWVIMRKSKLGYIIAGLTIIISSLWFWQNYIVEIPKVHARAWQLGTKEMILKAQELSSNYDKVWISRTGWGWIHLVFHTQYDPATFQQEVKVSPRNDLGFWWVSDVGKFHLEWLPKNFDQNLNVLYIATPQEFPEGISPINEVEKKGQVFWLVDKINYVRI